MPPLDLRQHPRVGPFSAGQPLTVHHGAFLNGETIDVAVFAEIDVVVHGQLLAQGGHRLLHRNQRAMAAFARESGHRRRILRAKNVFARCALDAIAANDGRVHGFGTILETDEHTVVAKVLQMIETLAPFRRTWGEEAGNFVEEICAACRVVARARDLADALTGSLSLLLHVFSVPEVEPGVLFRRPSVLVRVFDEASVDCRIDQFHGPLRIGTEGEAPADVIQVRGGLVDGDLDMLVFGQSDRKSYSSNSTANDGNVQGLVMVAAHIVGRVGYRD
jgi:hypothetical protein